MRFDFSGIDSRGVLRGFIEKLLLGMGDFFRRYPMPGSGALLYGRYETPSELFRAFALFVQDRVGDKLYVIIDEYDQFANEILAADKSLFHAMTSNDGFLKSFYANLKDQTASGTVSRIFMTGVTSVSLDSITSGFGIQRNISQLPAFADSLGFTDEELRGLVAETIDLDHCGVKLEQLMDRMRDYYNGYRFSPQSEKSVYNASMCLYYLSSLQDAGEEPADLFDPSVGTDISKMRSILELADEAVVREVVDAANRDQALPIPNAALSAAINLNARNRFDERSVLSFLFFLGFLTFPKGERERLRCPNKAVIGQFYEYFFQSEYGAAPTFEGSALRAVFQKLEAGEIEPLLVFVSERLQKSCGLHVLTHFSETALQVALKFAMLTNSDYEVTLEDEARGRGFCDLLLRPKNPTSGAAAYLLELKYFKRSDASEENIAHALEASKSQLLRYGAVEPAAAIENLRKVAAVFAGLQLCRVAKV